MSLITVTTSSMTTPINYTMTTSPYMNTTISSTPTISMSRPTDTACTGIVP